jgi:tetratricopeptide (TPR) repeat protein
MKIMPISIHSVSNPAPRSMRTVLSRMLLLPGLLAAALVTISAPPAFADDMADVAKLLKTGQTAEALAKAEGFLAKHPRDAQMRFLKGVILTEQNKSSEAIAMFTKLTEDFPDLPEPYNNLAVLYASSGQYDKARAALDTAIRTNPAYATAYENLGDVHAKLASQAYDKALQLDSANSAAKAKLTLLRTLAGNGASNAKVAAAPAPAPTPAPAAPKPVVVAAAPTPTAPPKATPPAVEPVKPVPPPVAMVKPEVKPAANDDSERDDVLEAIHGWAKAWSSQDVKTYLNFYGTDFQTPKGMSRKAWADERQSRIVGKGRINVKVESPQITINGNTATVKFRQIYESDRLSADSRKTLILTKQGGKWQIKQERAGS